MLSEFGGDTFLLDAFDAELLGGTGKSFKWAWPVKLTASDPLSWQAG